MAEVLLFHHAQGLTPGVRAFADELRAAGHTVHTPDLFDGRTFASIDEGWPLYSGPGSTTSARAAPAPPTTCRLSSSTPCEHDAWVARRPLSRHCHALLSRPVASDALRAPISCGRCNDDNRRI